MSILLEGVIKKAVRFLNREKSEFMIIGGVAAGVLGEPRVTGDVDIDIELEAGELSEFLDKAKRTGFKVNKKKCLARAKEAGVFQIHYGDFHLDFILASTELEKTAFKRKMSIRLYRLKAYFPTPEDFLLFKIIPGRPQDLVDAERVVLRYGAKLDRRYLEGWARRLSDESENMRIWNTLERLLRKMA